MIQNANSNNKISFLFSKANSIDLEALNLLAGKTEHILCSCSYCEDNGKHRLDYDAWLPSNLYLQKEAFLLESFIQACLEMFEVVNKYNLNLVNVKIETRYVFMEQDRYQFIYLPVLTKKKINKKKFVIKLFAQLKDKDSRVAGFLKRVKSLKTDEAVLSYLKECVSDTHATSVAEPEGETTILSQHVEEPEGETTILSQHVEEPEGETTILSQHVEESEGETTILSQHVAEPEGETTILSQHVEEPEEDTTIPSEHASTPEEETTAFFPNASADCETTYLSETPFYVARKELEADGEYNLFLLRVGTGEQIHINKSKYSIGKDVQTMDYVLGNQSVSRNHATIYIEDNKFYLTDNGSTNGTTIEGIRVQARERAELSDGDIISFGNEVFQVLLERK